MTSETAKLQRHIGRYELSFIAVSSVIGSGWLFSALYAAQYAGPAAIVSWIAGGVVVMLIALIYAELGTLFPEAGGLARYPMYSHGRLVSFYGAFTAWLAYVATAPIEVMAVVEYSAEFLPWVERSQGGDVVLTAGGVALAMAMLFVFCVINLVGVRWLARANNVIAVWKLFVPLIAALAIMSGRFEVANFTDAANGGFAPFGFAGVATALSTGGVMFAFLGFRAMLELAGEVDDPQRSIPFALVSGLSVCILIYLLLQVAFIGALAPSDLAQGWGSITFSVSTGPFAALAVALSMTWLATILYSDAIISPGGTALVFSGATARITYAMAKSGYAPRVLLKLNRYGVPAMALLVNFVIGALIFMPFPGWQKLVGFISSAAILSFALGPISLAALREQLPDRPRGYRLPWSTPLATLGFVVANLIFYWTGWDTNGILLLGVLGGFALAFTMYGFSSAEEKERWDLRSGLWLAPYLIVMAALSYAGNFGNGRALLPAGWDTALVVIVSIPLFRLALRDRKAVVEVTEETEA